MLSPFFSSPASFGMLTRTAVRSPVSKPCISCYMTISIGRTMRVVLTTVWARMCASICGRSMSTCLTSFFGGVECRVFASDAHNAAFTFGLRDCLTSMSSRDASVTHSHWRRWQPRSQESLPLLDTASYCRDLAHYLGTRRRVQLTHCA